MLALLIEDDPDTSAYVAQGLGRLGHRVEVAGDGRTGLVRGANARFDCLIVDRMLPGYDGLTVVRTLRTGGIVTPILFLTAVGGVADRVEGLRAGADDYLIKPFDLAELDARLQALARRPPLSSPSMLSARGLALDRLGRTVAFNGVQAELTESEFKILELLLLNASRPVTRTMLLETVFGLESHASAAIIEPHVSRLRAKLDRFVRPCPIRTVRGLGYQIDAD